jgi:F0F1-type ATP synthase membrane subunit b/b'
MQINLKPDLSLLVIMVIFIINYLVVSRFFLRPINEVLEAREHESKSAQKIYEESMARFSEATTQMEEKLHLERREATTLRDRFRAEAAQYRAGVVDKTSSEAKAMVTDADQHLSEDVKVARERIVTESEALARLAAERILGRPV